VKKNRAESISSWSTACQGRVEMENCSEGSIHRDRLLTQHLNGVCSAVLPFGWLRK